MHKYLFLMIILVTNSVFQIACATEIQPAPLPNTAQTPAVPSKPSDVIPPVISDVSASNITESGASITWITDEPSVGKVEFRNATSDNSTTETSTEKVYMTAHIFMLTTLSPAQTYNYKVYAIDSSGNRAVSKEGTFTTAPHYTYTPYTDTEYYFKVDVPSTWIAYDKEVLSKSYISAGFRSPEQCGSYFTNFNIVKRTLNRKQSALEYLAQDNFNSLSEYKSISTNIVTIDGNTVARHDFTFVSNNVTIRAQIYDFVQDMTVYCVAFGSNPSCYDKYASTFEKISSSFRIIR
jgi:hypothetical protein